MAPKARGFTLMEVLVAVVIIGVLSALALPAYTSYVTRSRLTEAYTSLASVQPLAEQYWSNNRTYVGMSVPSASTNFSYALTASSTSAYTVTATGADTMTGFSFTIDQAGNRATTGVPTGWTSSATCWVAKADGSCVQ